MLSALSARLCRNSFCGPQATTSVRPPVQKRLQPPSGLRDLQVNDEVNPAVATNQPAVVVDLGLKLGGFVPIRSVTGVRSR